MARRVFFSFHHQDVWRVSQVRNSWRIGGKESNRIIDAAEWEKVKRRGTAAVRQWIDNELERTSVTVVLIGRETASRRWVKYEIEESMKRGNGFLGIHIHQMKDQHGNSFWIGGDNPLKNHLTGRSGLLGKETLASKYQTFDWVDDDGRDNLADWVEEAARRASI